ncbi:excalibur calcium-binding domain-containing protein [Chromatium okenii]|uniref:excalibur calcium-binding domain-containing protein n=1 Tax=Chromatium okenii TaxID=61644 RepID=UPI001907C90A|nr:excalibur calcium-binding domain-containing protein [Chromatium okenii]
MKNIIVIAIFVVIGWYGSLLYQQNKLPFLPNLSSNPSHTATKCITKDGEVIYGNIPEGTVCEKIEPIDGSLTIVNKQENSDNPDTGDSKFWCDGRIYCSQMKSCEEATFFLRNCPNVKMDGNHDGIPCESQWCG